MGYLFVHYTDGIYQISKKVRVEDGEETQISKLLEDMGLNKEMFEVQEDDKIVYTLGGYTYYLEDRKSFSAINKAIEKILLEDSKRKKKAEEFKVSFE